MTVEKYLDYDGLLYYESTVKDRLDDKADNSDIPTALSELTNDDNYVQDADYTHTDIVTVKVNGSALTPANKAVDISVPTTVAELSDEADYAKKTDLVGGLKYKGSVQSYSQLPSSGQETGDMWNVATADATHGVAAGDNVVWNGSSWDVLRGDIDLSPYMLKADLVAITNSEIDDIVSGNNA